ncbi:MAG: hypothetical protein ACI8RZ_000853 [Myxococcota bacterium]|jgi:hypothetical protein
MPLLPAPRKHYDLPQTLHDLVIAHTAEDSFMSFTAADGALVDLEGLEAIAASPHRVVDAMLTGISPTATGMIVSGLELEGNPMIWSVQLRQEEEVRQVDIHARGLTRPSKDFQISEGSAIVTDAEGKRHVVTIEHPMRPENRPSATSALVLEIELVDSGEFARKEVHPRLRFVPLSQAGEPGRVIIASPAGSQAWATDINRLYQPSHPVILNFLILLDYLEHVVWDSDRHGWAWQRRQQGREWSRYQTTATLALQATRTCLMSQATSTTERVRLLRNLIYELRRSIENAESSIVKWLGETSGPDPYRAAVPCQVELRGPEGRPPSPLLKLFQQIFGDYAMRELTSSVAVAWIFPPLTATGVASTRQAFQQLADFQDGQHRINETFPPATEIRVHVTGGVQTSLSEPATIIEQFIAVTGWQAK